MNLAKHTQAFLAETLRPLARPFTDCRFVVGVSGGVDSLVLLHILAQLVPHDHLLAAHLNHGWRDTAVLDAQFVAQTAAAWGVACAIETVNVVAQAQERGQSLEEAGRQARYRFFARLAHETNATAVLVAHHADDQAETVLLNLLRGTGLAGLSGMKPASPMPEAPEIVLLRPFLTISRADIETYSQQHGLTPVHDSTNADTTFLRNRIRHHLLPQLATYNPQFATHLRQLAEIAATDEAYLDQLAAENWPTLVQEQSEGEVFLHRDRWLALPLALQRRMLRRAVAVLRPSLADIIFLAIEQARLVAERGQVGAQSSLPGDLVLRVDYGRLHITATNSRPNPDKWPQVPAGALLPLKVPGTTQLANNWIIETSLLPQIDPAQAAENQDPWVAYLAADATGLTVRGRYPGERMTPLGMNGRSASLKEIMVNRKISAPWRPNWPLVSSADHTLWLVGHQIDERAKITPAAPTALRLLCRKS